MRKRRRLANKLTIMVCAVLVVVSAFFYAPMEVAAADSISLTTRLDNIDGLDRYLCENKGVYDSKSFDFSPYLDADSGLYKVTFKFSAKYYCLSDLSSYPFWLNVFTCMNTADSYYQMSSSSPNWQREFGYSQDGMTVYIDAENPVVNIAYFFVAVFQYNVAPTVNFSMGYDISDVSVEKVSDKNSSEYQNGYNAGYSDGAMIGYGDGYSDGFKDGEISVDTGAIYDEGYQAGKDSVDTDAFYDEGYQAGKDSVDTDSYFDAGYQQGYQVAYSSGYDEGYQVAYDIAFSAGYDKAMGDISQWGADTSDYPLFLKSYSDDIDYNFLVEHGVTRDYPISLSQKMSISIDPNHTYKIVFDVSDYDITTNSNTESAFASDVYLYVGSLKYFIANQSSSRYSHIFYVPGDKMGDYFTLQNICYNMETFNTTSDQVAYWKFDYNMSIYDMGPSGDTQNHIANQTDKLNENSDKNTDIMVNGFDESQGNSVNSDLSSGLNEYQTAEDSLWATSTTGLKDFTFFDFESVPAMITGMSFITSIMGSWFNHAGGASGVGIVLSILFSVMLVAMVLGLYRLYQSRGGKK